MYTEDKKQNKTKQNKNKKQKNTVFCFFCLFVCLFLNFHTHQPHTSIIHVDECDTENSRQFQNIITTHNY